MFKIHDETYIRRTIKFLVTILIIFLVTFILAIIFSPSTETIKNLSKGIPSNVANAVGLEKVWEYILNNGFKVPFQMLILAIIPIPFLYYLNIISTAIPPAIALGFVINYDIYKGIMVTISSIPHFFVEILAFCFVASGLVKVNQAIIRKITNLFRKNKKENLSLKLSIINLLKIYVFIALPLFVIAAFFENYLSKFIFDLLT
ncbi:stage II sporulation protein M [Staphylococcus warneri]|uniref:stage II sporulation protein M n=1 Tax=Staphylococcus warneri TaxID=1292 RepID=UPI0002D26253|nr:stage II sporulation protein M [Staphylococcus warneri]MBF0769388.1 stage II sporulation protein M [Staphylococcus warneri]MCI2747353.1 stage II sporulation protein M [Staphylococcus warneri]MCI2766488.1 stage II sporulation protein M [Staphylococcus warneri]MCI2775921.1 stage II sporulation protein M [Staphylococcus warneri]MCI2786566.1 stage II sporulation protein M [Staphylococcus warneri]